MKIRHYMKHITSCEVFVDRKDGEIAQGDGMGDGGDVPCGKSVGEGQGKDVKLNQGDGYQGFGWWWNMEARG